MLDINALMFLAVAGAVALQDYVEGAAVLVLFGVAQWLEERSSRAARDAISSVLALKPETAILADSGEFSQNPAVSCGWLCVWQSLHGKNGGLC